MFCITATVAVFIHWVCCYRKIVGMSSQRLVLNHRANHPDINNSDSVAYGPQQRQGWGLVECPDSGDSASVRLLLKVRTEIQ